MCLQLIIPTVTGGQPVDRDDTWHVTNPFLAERTTNREVSLGSGLLMELKLDTELRQNRETQLRFKVVDGTSRPIELEPFMGMGGHLILRRSDGTVFTHLHPSGTFSMAAQQLFEMRAEGKAPLRVASSKGDPLCRLPGILSESRQTDHPGQIVFRYSFSRAGSYRLWVQAKVSSKILTGVFDLNVLPAVSDR